MSLEVGHPNQEGASFSGAHTKPIMNEAAMNRADDERQYVYVPLDTPTYAWLSDTRLRNRFLGNLVNVLSCPPDFGIGVIQASFGYST